ncbi:MAG: NADH:ubiquinone reductase (Na(+)-transporting) subunit A [Bacteroidia bacterium]|nr:MAG: NADH:ubiquinone reductase (Na(+)-transporting) subunit A [Bacteroidia bacterium]
MDVRIRKGLDIKLVGQAEKVYDRLPTPGDYALYPTDFPMMVPRLRVREGDVVKAGSPLFVDKRNEDIVFASPVSGTVKQVLRGERRRVEKVVVGCGTEELEYEDFGAAQPSGMAREAVVEKMLKGGVWPLIRQRPFNVVADPRIAPRDIFISAFDSAPLAPDLDFSLKDNAESFQLGLDALRRLTDGGVHIGINGKYPPAKVYASAQGVQLHSFSGPHPAGNVGVQISHIAPVCKGEVVWTVSPLDVIIIGRLFASGRYDARRIIAVAGSRVEKPRYYTTLIGAPMAQLLDGQVKPGPREARIISGNVLTGIKTGLDEWVHYYANMVTVIPEGNYYEFMGWLAPGLKKFSASHMFPAFLMPKRTYDLDTHMHGGHRAFVVTGQFERVMPMDIYPNQLLKAILAKDIEGMENLGIYEVAEEDFALCDFVSTSKIEAQTIVREGLNQMIREMY